MIDMHCHILPGIDDGSKSMNDSVEMARMLVEAGFRGVMATPHVLGDDDLYKTREFLLEKVEKLKSALAEAAVDLEVYLGGEYYLDRSVADLCRAHREMAGWADSLYVLVEMPVMQIPPYMEYSVLPSPKDPPEVSKLLPYLRPVIAHPERNEKIFDNYKRMKALRNFGYLFQVNLESVTGAAGKTARKVVKNMAKEHLIDFVGTDGHSPSGIERVLPKDLRKKIEKVIGKKTAARVLDENPSRVLRNKPVEPERYY